MEPIYTVLPHRGFCSYSCYQRNSYVVYFPLVQGGQSTSSISRTLCLVRTRQVRKSFADPFMNNYYRDLIRAFKSQDDIPSFLHDVRAAIPATVIARIRILGLQSAQGSLLEHQAAMVEF